MEFNATEFPIPEILSVLELAPLLVGISTVYVFKKVSNYFFPLTPRTLIILYFPITYRNVSVLCQSEFA